MSSTDGRDLAPKRTGYYPLWLDNLADDGTCEAAAMQGTLHVGRVRAQARNRRPQAL